jgi:hypothetical protein
MKRRDLSARSTAGVELVFGGLKRFFLPLQIVIMSRVAGAVKKLVNQANLVSVPLLTFSTTIASGLSKVTTIPNQYYAGHKTPEGNSFHSHPECRECDQSLLEKQLRNSCVYTLPFPPVIIAFKSATHREASPIGRVPLEHALRIDLSGSVPRLVRLPGSRIFD